MAIKQFFFHLFPTSYLSINCYAVEEPEGVHMNPLPAPGFKYPMEMKYGLSETRLFHFRGIFMKK